MAMVAVARPRRFNCTAILLLLTVAAFIRSSAAATYVVGDALGWTIPPNPSIYSTWASSKTFLLGDILLFNFTGGRHDVAEVTKASFDSCNANNPISDETSSPARITLTAAGDHHFICSFPGHCDAGQKLTVTVRGSTSPAPRASTPSPATAPSLSPSTPKPSTAPSPSPRASTPSRSPNPGEPPLTTSPPAITPPPGNAESPSTNTASSTPSPTGAPPPPNSANPIGVFSFASTLLAISIALIY